MAGATALDQITWQKNCGKLSRAAKLKVVKTKPQVPKMFKVKPDSQMCGDMCMGSKQYCCQHNKLIVALFSGSKWHGITWQKKNCQKPSCVATTAAVKQTVSATKMMKARRDSQTIGLNT